MKNDIDKNTNSFAKITKLVTFPTEEEIVEENKNKVKINQQKNLMKKTI